MTVPSRQILAPKRQSETVQVTFDFSEKCAAGETLSAPAVSVSVWSGVDPTPNAIYVTSSAAVSGQTVTLSLQAGVTGVVYLVTVSATGSISTNQKLEGLFAILPEGV